MGAQSRSQREQVYFTCTFSSEGIDFLAADPDPGADPSVKLWMGTHLGLLLGKVMLRRDDNPVDWAVHGHTGSEGTFVSFSGRQRG